ncbi:hypothetical protein DMUE_1883, partial [Dictyocoela muelleri]
MKYNINNLNLIKSKRNKDMLVYDGYIYNLRREKDTMSFWRCVQRGCGGRMKTELNSTIIDFSTHSHQRDFSVCEAVCINYNIKKRALTTTEKPRNIINKYVNPSETGIIEKISKYTSIRDRITKQRVFNNLDQSDMEYDINPINLRTRSFEDFVFFDSGMLDPERVVIFGTNTSFTHLKNSSFWLCDGTFKSCPNDFNQIYTIMGEVRGAMYPLIYILVKKKSTNVYDIIFDKISKKILTQPKFIIIDFESAAYLSLKKNFPNSSISGCFFHLSQIIWRRIQKEGLTTVYKSNSYFRACSRMILAFSFLPKSFIPEMVIHYENYISNFEFHEDINLIWRFFKSNYLRLNSENTSIFSYEFWTTSGRVSENVSLTTNCLERWHRSLNSHFQNAHPNLNTLLSAIHIEHNIASIKIIQSLYKQVPYKEINYELKNILDNKDEYQGIELLITLVARMKIKCFSNYFYFLFFTYKIIFNFKIYLKQRIYIY